MFAIIDVGSDEVLSFAESGRELAPQVGGFKSSGRTPRIVELPSNEEWQQRERARMADGTYSLVPWHAENWYLNHPLMNVLYFPHVSTDDKAKLAYTQSPSRGRDDRQTRVTPRSFLERFHHEIGSFDINYWVDIWEQIYSPWQVLFAKDADDIERVYISGPGSCMSHHRSKYESSFHPVRVYAKGDLSLAYMQNTDGRVLCRALVWPEQKLFGRVYGTHGEYTSVFRKRLRSLGYTSPYDYNSLAGAKIGRFPDRDGKGIVCPYIDGNNDEDHAVHDTGDWLIIGYPDDFNDDWVWLSAGHTNGYADGKSYLTCCECGHSDWMSSDWNRNHGGRWVCSSCSNTLYFHCDYCGGFHRSDTSVVVPYHGRSIVICCYCAKRNRVTCDHCGEQFFIGNSGSPLRSVHNGLRVCTSCIDTYYFRCGINGILYPVSMRAGYLYSPSSEQNPVSMPAVENLGLRYDPFLGALVRPIDDSRVCEQEHDDPVFQVDWDGDNASPRRFGNIRRALDSLGRTWYHCPTH